MERANNIDNRNIKKNCEYCGNNPVPHLVFWYFESLNILLAPVRRFLLKVFSFVSFDFSKVVVSIGGALGIINFNTELKNCKVERAKVLWEEAERRGIKMRELLLFGKPFDVYCAENSKFQIPNSKFIFSGLPRPKNIDRVALDAMDNKGIWKKKISAAGLPVPKGESVWNFAQARSIFSKLLVINNKLSVIVKPRAGSRGRHSTTFVSNLDELKKAYKIAKQLCFWVVVEEMLLGPVYRATLINYELCGVLRGDPPEVVGDGVHSINELIEIKNAKPHPGVKNIVVDASVERFLSRQGLTLSAILKVGEVINLSEKIGVNYGGSSSEDFEICHVDNKELFEKAAKIVGDPIIGFDFIIPDITKSWKTQKCGFIEANSLPFINLHHNPLHGQPRNVATKVWDMVVHGSFLHADSTDTD